MYSKIHGVAAFLAAVATANAAVAACGADKYVQHVLLVSTGVIVW
jgi:hypothetical protein